VQQKLHHVVFGEKLRHGRDRARVDLVAALVDLFLPGCLPELVHPAETVVRQKRLRRQFAQQFLERQPMFRGELDFQEHVVGAKHLRQHAAGVPGRQDEAVCRRRIGTRRQFVAFRQADRHAIRVHQQMILGQEPGEQHSMPIFVSEFLRELVDRLRLVVVPQISRLLPPRPQLIPQVFFPGSEMRKRFRRFDGPLLQRRTGGLFRLLARSDTDVFELSSQIGSKSWHRLNSSETRAFFRPSSP
jgi:hypothetical protein